MLSRWFFIGFCGLFLSVNVCAAAWNQPAGSWSTVVAEDPQGIVIQERSIIGTNVREFRAEIVVSSSMGTLVNMLRDVHRYPQWMHRIAEVAIVKQNSPYDYLVYTVIASPWPFHNRDVFVHTHISQNTQTGTVLIRSISEPSDTAGLMPECIRMPEMDTDWALTPLANDRVKVEFRGFGLPGGMVPDWAVNMVVTDLPYGSLRNLESEMRRRSSQKPVDESPVHILEYQDLPHD